MRWKEASAAHIGPDRGATVVASPRTVSDANENESAETAGEGERAEIAAHALSRAERRALNARRRAERKAERARRLAPAREDIWNLPNALTMARVAMIPAVLWFVEAGTPRHGYWGAWLYGATAVTDLLDGYLARKRNLITIFGKFMDPLADKLLVISLLVFLTRMGRIAPWIVAVLVGREVAITSLRAIASSEGVVIAAGESGKWKTALQMVGILCLILHFPYRVLPFYDAPVDLNVVGQWLVLLSLVFSITSAVEYAALFVAAVEAQRQRGR
ncbi:MAG: CDP-diacylglycerol--glycerol-3-phosphate 3-phosphatidyltransferase [Myxococcales bacterium]|nr:CDP-diacylglycerol--glycerol-3-phosphate 3-phosphatidyltransferase [Myxococcales bacterium]